ncbi:ABC transporter ATP-binding protein [Salinibacterium sp. SWN248]|uniref:ABC transporter ATP-binding protein n=1 Tax=Salinibacterium sp. SWN248 TaxID=2792056 RepID=UPI0018CF432B|nr:ABC transporter ATP-binding protein [Salinibacterium sp. SWN248]MBH0023311.1 ABC transporter ATP-binding protein [Salinibacterium sp. SWN248]
MTYAIETHALTKRYGSNSALEGLDLAVETGSVFGMIGPNGAGKTTAMRLLLDIIRPTSGSATVLGKSPIAGGAALRRDIGFLPGELLLEGRITGRSLLKHYAAISGPVAPGRIDALSERLGLDITRHVRTLSKGNKQKLGLVQAFMHEPKLLVLDEPTSGLDPLVQQEFLSMVREAQHNGQTVFLSSHVLSEIQNAADQVAVLRNGTVVKVGDVASLRASAIRRVVIDFTDAAADDIRTALIALPQLDNLTVTAGDVVHVTGTVEGHIDALVKAIASFHVVDLRVEEQDLESSVIDLYSNEATK